jgi:hypothetical protein
MGEAKLVNTFLRLDLGEGQFEVYLIFLNYDKTEFGGP